MDKTKSNERAAGPQFDFTKTLKAEVKLGNAFVRLTAKDRRKVLRLFEHLLYGKLQGKVGSSPFWDQWTEDDMLAFYQQLLPISQKMANDWRGWACEYLKGGCSIRAAVEFLVDELAFRRWIEDLRRLDR
jgi:hypothetical protein